MATHSSILAWKILWTEKAGGLLHGIAKTWTWLSMHACTYTCASFNPGLWWDPVLLHSGNRQVEAWTAIFLGQGPSNLNAWSPVESLPAPSKSLTAGALSTVQYGAVVPRIPSASKTFIYQFIHAFIQREDFIGEVSLELVFEKEK